MIGRPGGSKRPPPVAMMMNAATTQVRNEPTNVSILPNLMSLDVQPLVHHGALLEEDLPGRDGRADVGHDQR